VILRTIRRMIRPMIRLPIHLILRRIRLWARRHA
jgi:hypothetical protein